jgi:hypothetical protein
MPLSTLARSLSIMTTTKTAAVAAATVSPPRSPHSPPTPTASSSLSSPAPSSASGVKRARLDTVQQIHAPVASTSKLPYDRGLHLAPMVRIGTLPVRLLCQSHTQGDDDASLSLLVHSLTPRSRGSMLQPSSTAQNWSGAQKSLTKPSSDAREQ